MKYMIAILNRDLRYKRPIHNLIILDNGCVRSPLYYWPINRIYGNLYKFPR